MGRRRGPGSAQAQRTHGGSCEDPSLGTRSGGGGGASFLPPHGMLLFPVGHFQPPPGSGVIGLSFLSCQVGTSWREGPSRSCGHSRCSVTTQRAEVMGVGGRGPGGTRGEGPAGPQALHCATGWAPYPPGLAVLSPSFPTWRPCPEAVPTCWLPAFISADKQVLPLAAHTTQASAGFR